ncbi:MAG TPA: DMT family transporter [Sporichthyaceae bacterium]|jgi:drug/metabolite transporter (DMT)-like permease
MTAVALALLAGLLFASAVTLQQRVSRSMLPSVAPSGAGWVSRCGSWLPITGALSQLVRHPLWLTGWALNVAGFTIQAMALHHGSVALVQPILVTQLLFTIVIGALLSRRAPAPTDFAGGAAVCLGIMLFVANWNTDDQQVTAYRVRVLTAVIAALCLALVLVARASRMRRPVRAVFVSIAAGLCFSVTAVLLKLTLDSLLNDGIGPTLRDWFGYLLIVSTCMGLVIGQDALASGALSTAVAGMAITNPVASAVIGVLAFHESLPSSRAALVGLCAAGLLIVLGVLALAQSATIRSDAPGGPDGGPPRPYRALERRFT